MKNEHSDDLLHLSGCDQCRRRFVADNVVSFPGDPNSRAARRRELFDTARRLREEKESAAGVVARYLRVTPPDDWPRLADVPELRNSAALEQMSEEVRRLLDREPREALSLSNLATDIAESLPSGIYPDTVIAQLRATAWKDRANALRYLARYPEAIEAINTAEERLEPHAALAYDRAVVRLVKAMVAHQVGQPEAAYALLRHCRTVFGDFGDDTRAIMAGRIEANFLYDGGRFEDARAMYSSLLASVRGDLETEADLHSNLGYCAIHIGDFPAANIHFSEAIAGFTEIGHFATALKTERGAGNLLVKKGQVRSGLERLASVRSQYLEHGLIQDAGLAGLDIVEALVIRGDIEDARKVARQIRVDFAEAAMDQYAIAALERLDAAIATGGSVDALLQVRNVSTFIQNLRTNVNDDFRL